MTTTVIVKAHCDQKTTKVKVETLDGSNPQPDIFIEDGDVYEAVVFDGRELKVSEVEK